ncbi:MAG TPA: hypothetical protein DHU75_06465 [Rikenellaceae bacterium]|nr:hypothetical protein [Rikenellaceae bacterium]
MQTIDHRRIAKNTILLYFRMGLIALVGLWTSRIVLNCLGVVDFGLYNVLGGIVVAFSFMSGALSASCNRYYSVELGKRDYTALKEVFKANVLIFLLFALIIFILCESLGLWLIDAKLVIPQQRIAASRWVYQFSVITFIFSLMAIPYKSLIMAKEKLKVYAYSSIIEAFLKLSIVFLLNKAPFDTLVFYSLLNMLISLGTNLFYILYCKRFYAECRYDGRPSRKICIEILRFNGWGVIGSLATATRNQGVNILLNMFYGPAVNAARGLANQIYSTIYQFVQNYALAFAPQIVKSYSAGQKNECNALMLHCSTLAFLMLSAVAFPIIFEMPEVMHLWLVNVPEHAIAFARIMMATALVDALYPPLFHGIQATGQVKWLNILCGGCQILVVLIAYCLMKWGRISSEMVFVLIFCGAFISQIIRIILAHKYLLLSIKDYFKKVLLPVISATFLYSASLLALSLLLDSGIARLLISFAISIFISATFVLISKKTRYDRA